MSSQQLFHRLPVFEAERIAQAQFFEVSGWQSMGLLFIDLLQPVLDSAQKPICFAQVFHRVVGKNLTPTEFQEHGNDLAAA